MEIQQLRHLLAAAKLGNLVRAAEETNISQPGLSRSIRSLENRLGVPLLVRGTKGVEPTIFGQSVLRRARVIVNEIQRAQEELRALQASNSSELKFGITQNFAHYFIPEVIAHLQATRHDISFNIVTGDPMEIVEMVRSAEIDFGFGLLGAIDETSDITIERLKRHRSHVVARAQHPLASQRNVSFEDLAAARWATAGDEAFQRSFRNFFVVRGLTPPARSIMTSSLELIKNMVLSADLLTILPEDMLQNSIASRDLVTINCEALNDFNHLGFIFRADEFITPQMKLATDSIRNALTAAEAPLRDLNQGRA